MQFAITIESLVPISENFLCTAVNKSYLIDIYIETSPQGYYTLASCCAKVKMENIVYQ